MILLSIPAHPQFLLAPPREGRPEDMLLVGSAGTNFYSRPHGRGDGNFPQS